MTPGELSSAILAAVRDAVADGELAVPVPGRAETRTTPEGEQISPVALQLAGPAGRPAAEVAALLAERLAGVPEIEDVRVTGPGFLTVAMVTTLPDPLDGRHTKAPLPEPVEEDVKVPQEPVGEAHIEVPPAAVPEPRGASWASEGSGADITAPPATVTQPISGAETEVPQARWPEPVGGADVEVVKVSRAIWPDRPRTFANPGFRVRFAYARAAAVRRHAREMGITAVRAGLTDPRERRVAGLVGEYGHRVRRARPLARYLEVLADAYHDVYEQCPVLPKGDEPVAHHHRVRLSLAEAVHTVVGNGLRMLGENPAERL